MVPFLSSNVILVVMAIIIWIWWMTGFEWGRWTTWWWSLSIFHEHQGHNLTSQVPQLYCIQLGVQYPKNSKIWLWLLPQPTLGNALVEVDKNWNISGLLSGFQLEKLFFIHTVRSYSHSTATAEFVTSIGLKKWDGFLTFSTVFVKITQEKSQILPRTNLKVLKCEKYSWSEASDDITNPAVAFTNSAVAVEWL